MQKNTYPSTVFRSFLTAILVISAGVIGLAFASNAPQGLTDEGKIVGEGWQTPLASPHGLSLLYNDAMPARVYYRPEQTTITTDNPWKSVSLLPAPAADGSKQLKLYDLDSHSLPLQMASPQNIVECSTGNIARFGTWRAYIDELGQVWTWMESGEEEGMQPEPKQVSGLPFVTTVALGHGHLVALTP